MEQDQKMNQNIQNLYPSSSPITLEEILSTGLSVKRFANLQDVIDFYRTEIIGLREEIAGLRTESVELQTRIKKLEERRVQLVAIQNLDSKELELKMPLVVTIESTEQDTFVVWSEDLNTYGEGKSEEMAKEDFLKSAEELYFDLKEDKDKLGPAMEKIWEFLQKIVKEI